MKLLTILMQKAMIVPKILFLFGIILSCKTRKVVENISQEMSYDVIEIKKYNDSALFYKTIPGNELVELRLSYESLNQNNYDKNWALEKVKHINFDTIFNKEQQSEINKKIESLESVVLEPSQLKNPDILHKPGKNSKGAGAKKIGLEKITFPFFQEGKDGDLFAFIYRENPTQGIFYVYRFKDGQWKEFSKLQLWIT